MLPPERPDRIHVAFDNHRLVANAGLILPVTLAHHLELGELMDRHVDLILQPQISSRSLLDRRRYLTIPVLGLLQFAPQPQINETFGE